MSDWAEAKAPDGRSYYYNKTTKETSWTKPEGFDATPSIATPANAATATPAPNQDAIDVAWKSANAADGRPYYYNAITRQTVWEAPEAFVKQQQQMTESAAPAFVAGGSSGYGQLTRQNERSDHRDRGLPQKPAFDGGRGGGGGQPREGRPEREQGGFRGAMPAKNDGPDYASAAQAEEAFFKLLKTKGVTQDTKWKEALALVVREHEFRAIKEPRDRQLAFEKYRDETRKQAAEKEEERRQKVKKDFRQMLSTHDDIKHYTRWKTAKAIIEREAAYRAVEKDDDRRLMLEDYVRELKLKHADAEYAKHRAAVQEVISLFRALSADSNNATWTTMQESLAENPRFNSEEIFKPLSKSDVLTAYKSHVNNVDAAANAVKQKEKRMGERRARQARDGFKQLLTEMVNQNKIKAGSKWMDFVPLVADDERYNKLLIVASKSRQDSRTFASSSTPQDLFWDAVEKEEHKLRSKRNTAMDILEDEKYEMTRETTQEGFLSLMRSDRKRRMTNESEDTLQMIYERLMEKVVKRAEDEKTLEEKRRRQDMDDLRTVIKRLEPPVGINDTYEDVAKRVEHTREYQELDDEELRRSAFEKHMRRFKESQEDQEKDRARRDRERDRGRRGSGRREDRRRSRSREDRRRSRSPELDAYEADRRKAIANRERRYNKTDFRGTPPPRDHRGSDRRSDRRDPDDLMYDRELHSENRADPRDKGRTLDYGDEDAVGSRPSSVRKRASSDASQGSQRPNKRTRRSKTPTAGSVSKDKQDEEPIACQSGSEEGEIEE